MPAAHTCPQSPHSTDKLLRLAAIASATPDSAHSDTPQPSHQHDPDPQAHTGTWRYSAPASTPPAPDASPRSQTSPARAGYHPRSSRHTLRAPPAAAPATPSVRETPASSAAPDRNSSSPL